MPVPPYAPVAQLDRVTDSDSVGRRFDSCRVHHNINDLQKIVKLKNTVTHCDKAKKRGSEGIKIGVGIILGYKYLDGYAETAVKNYSVQTNSLEIGLRISW